MTDLDPTRVFTFYTYAVKDGRQRAIDIRALDRSQAWRLFEQVYGPEHPVDFVVENPNNEQT